MFYQFNHPATVDYFKIETGKNFNFPAHIHECFELITVLNGQMTVIIDGQRFVISKGEAILIFPNLVHSLESENSEHLLCIFSPKLVAAYASKVSKKKPKNPIFILPINMLKTLTETTEEYGTFAKKGLLYLICDSFDNKREYVTDDADNKNLLNKIFAFIENNYKEKCDLRELSLTINYDYAYLSRYFKNTIGFSFNNYVNIYRLNNACYLFDNTKQSILNCAMESGYQSIRSFNRNFKKHFGITPNEYIKQKNT